MRKSLMAVLCLFAMMTCEKSKIEILQGRLDQFRNILPPELRQQFDSGNYQTVIAGIDSLIEHDPEFEEGYDKLKHGELIDVFSSHEVVDFFREYFVEEIERLKTNNEGSW